VSRRKKDGTTFIGLALLPKHQPTALLSRELRSKLVR
jgi:hypothetical protein